MTRFNPSLVRLARLRPSCSGGLSCGFQSQLGSIGAITSTSLGAVTVQVSIPAWFDWRNLKRLRTCSRALCFNPSLVRLAPHPRACPRFCQHLVSIPAWFDWRSAAICSSLDCSKGFNPSLVRLAPPPFIFCLQCSISFNPSLVRLAPAETPFETGPIIRFNPSLVRLAPGWPSLRRGSPSVFQSQLGSIGARGG